MNDPKGTICTRVQEISSEYQEGTFISRKRTCYENNSEVSDGPQRKNAKQVASKKNLKKGNLVLKMQVYQKKLVEKEHLCIKPKLLRQQDLSMVLLIVVIWKLKFLMN